MNIDEQQKNFTAMSVTWACGTIAKFAPHLYLQAVPAGWKVFWKDDNGNPDFTMPMDAETMDWRELCDFARQVLDDVRRSRE